MFITPLRVWSHLRMYDIICVFFCHQIGHLTLQVAKKFQKFIKTSKKSTKYLKNLV